MKIPSKKFLITQRRLVKKYNAEARKLEKGDDKEKKLGLQKHKFALEIMKICLEMEKQGKALEEQYSRRKKDK